MSIAVFSAQQTQQLFDLFSAMTDYYAATRRASTTS